MEYFDKYLTAGMNALVIGKNSSLFIDEYREKFVAIYGVENVEHPFIYRNKLEDIHFPTDYFDVVICNGFEKNLLPEIFRILKQINQNGRFIWNIPPKQLVRQMTVNVAQEMLIKVGFLIEFEDEIMIHARKPVQNRVKILFPPGIGDSYWSLIKLQSFLKEKNIGMPDIYVSSLPDKYNSHTRGFPFIEMFPFVNVTWKVIGNDFVGVDNIEWSHDFWREAYTSTEKGVNENVTGCDYFIVYNGAINAGIPLEQVDPHLECNWNPPMFVSLRQERFRQRMQKQYGKYIVFCFGFRGTSKYWVDQFSIKNIIEFIKRVSVNFTPILIGGVWDLLDDVGLNRIVDETGCVDMLGRTSVEEVFGLIRGSEMITGFPNGLMMVAPSLGVKTLSIWSDYYPEGTFWNVVAPDTRNELYFVEKAKDLTVDHLINRITEICI